jgi:chromosomal replication initiation ATPase DnaA
MSTKTINDFPGVKKILDRCQEDVQEIIGLPVGIKFLIDIKSKTEVDIREAICIVCNVTWDQVIKSDRYRNLVIARQLYCYFVKKFTQLTLREIGKHIGDRDHTTVIHSIDSLNNLIDSKNEEAVDKLNKVNAILFPQKYETEAYISAV